jgi:hypothetical protein
MTTGKRESLDGSDSPQSSASAMISRETSAFWSASSEKIAHSLSTLYAIPRIVLLLIVPFDLLFSEAF